MYDLIVMGGGPGGYMAAEQAGKAGLKTLLIEKETLGGVCLNEGCIPTKTLLNSAKIYHHCTPGGNNAYGVNCSNPEIDHRRVLARKEKVVKTLVRGVQFQMKHHHVEVLKAVAKLQKKTDDGFEVCADGNVYRAKHVIVATGSSAVVPPIDGAAESMESGFAATSRELLSDPVVPQNLVVVGGGVIGLEFVSYFNTIGTKVTVIEMMDKIAGPMDRDLSSELQKVYKKRGVEFILSAKVTQIKDGAVCYEKDGEVHTVFCDKVLVSVGRRANTAGIGLEEVSAAVERGVLMTDNSCRTNVEGLYAIGDVNGKVMLAHTAYREAECVVRQLLGRGDAVDYDVIPSVIYTNPEVAAVGYTEKTAFEKYGDVETIALPMSYSGRFVAENEDTSGFCKVLFDRESKTMIGAHCMANYSSEFIEICTVLIALRIKIGDMKKLVFPHPTVCEILHEIIQASTLEE